MPIARLTVLLLVLSVALGQRVVIQVSGGALDPFAIGFLCAAAVLWVRDDLQYENPAPYRALALNTIGPLLVLMAVLPVVGVALGWYNVTVLYAWLVPAIPVGILSLARLRLLHGLRLEKAGFALILVHGLYGLGQTLYRLGLLPESSWGWASTWDLNSQAAVSDSYLIVTRSTGLFINANLFGLWSCLAIVFSAVLLRGSMRAVGVALGILGVMGSQSRTAWLGLALVAFIVVVRAIRDARLAGRLLGWSLALLPLLATMWLVGLLPRLIESQLVTRLSSGLSVVSGGSSSDRNLGSRVDSWGDALIFTSRYPFGTLGPPQQLYGAFIDNDFVSVFLQGGVLLLGAFVFALFSPIVLWRRDVPHSAALGLIAALFALFSLTMLPLESPAAAALAWLTAAICLGFERHPNRDCEGGGSDAHTNA